MAMGTRETHQPPQWIAASDLPASPGHPFYGRLNACYSGVPMERLTLRIEDEEIIELNLEDYH
jgi:hypothetical protein